MELVLVDVLVELGGLVLSPYVLVAAFDKLEGKLPLCLFKQMHQNN